MKYVLPYSFVSLFKNLKLRCDYKKLLLAVSVCLPLLGCSNQAAPNASADNDLAGEQVVSEKQLSSDMTTAHAAAIDGGEEDEGASLMDSAKTGDSEKKQRSPMIAEKRADSALQATLIGNYTGVIPCATCDELTLTLNLYSDGTVKQTSVYENSEIALPPLIEMGVYRQDNDMITVVYDQENIDNYRIQGNHLIMLDANKQSLTDYTLSRH